MRHPWPASLLFDLYKIRQYPREVWRPVLQGSFPAFEQEWGHPARAWDLVEGLRLHLRRHIVSAWAGGEREEAKRGRQLTDTKRFRGALSQTIVSSKP